ncbi:putative N-acetylated-alpha-linked acidic dipeptidase isoform X2 [Apostichopus japonicus]|uniref:putative N-acetylated-alpha-linked acidic dipeptidase isoform X2 n=1 Tax=Stichopus japonicus TaxID=307972 RepID=UPI003AB3D914
MVFTADPDANFKADSYNQFTNEINMDESELEIHPSSYKDYKRRVSIKTLVLTSILVAACGIGVGVLIGWFSKSSEVVPNDPEISDAFKVWQEALEETDGAEVTKMLLDEINPENIRENLRLLTKKPHLAGTEADKEMADYVKSVWDTQGMETTRIVPYDVLLSYPDPEKPNLITILNSDGTDYFQSQPEESKLDEGDKHNDTVFPFNAYAPAGVVEGELVYVNYARAEDFKQLEDLGVNASGKVVIARYGKIFRGDKENQAWLRGAKGLILYSDPADYAIEGSSSVYPDSWYMPPSGIQRGTVFRPMGDPLTPGYPATETAFREKYEDSELPNIPVQPIGYGDAIHILREMAGDAAPDEWSGGLNVTYKLGPGLVNNRNIKLDVNNRLQRNTTYNIIGTITGSLEPDRYVMIGNHHDAWVFGAVDPSSGTAVLLELSRVMTKLVMEGKWRPRRTIVFCSWGAEEYGLIGSTEWVEEFTRPLVERAVAYINIDIAVQGNFTFRGKATPNLYNALYDATKAVPDAPFEGHSSNVYDTWLRRMKDNNLNVPYISNVGSGSDYAVLLSRLGVPAVDLRYTYDPASGLAGYPLYHSMYETFYLVNDILDPSFEYHRVIARVCAELARNLADSLILPFKASDYAFKMRRSLDGPDGLKEAYEEKMATRGLSFDAIDIALNYFTAAGQALEAKILHKRYGDSPFAVRKVNDQLMLMERAFIDPQGLPNRPLVRHIVFAPSSKDGYFGDIFPGIMDLMYDIENGMDNDSKWAELEKHMSVIAFTIQSAANTLVEVGELHARP